MNVNCGKAGNQAVTVSGYDFQTTQPSLAIIVTAAPVVGLSMTH